MNVNLIRRIIYTMLANNMTSYSSSGVLFEAFVYDDAPFKNRKKTLAHCKITVPKLDGVFPFDTIVVVDKSGSMHCVLDNIKATLGALYDIVSPEGGLTVVTFSDEAEILYSRSEGEHCRLLFDSKIETLKAEGSTNIERGLDTAFNLQHMNKRTSLILLSDGIPNFGAKYPAEFEKLIKLRKNNTTIISTVGFGLNYNFEILKSIGHLTHVEDVNKIPGIIGSTISTVRTSIGFDCRINIPVFGEDVIGTTSFPSLCSEKVFSYAQFVDASSVENIEGKYVNFQYFDLDGLITISTNFIKVKLVPVDIKKLYYNSRGSQIARDISKGKYGSTKQVLKRVKSWPEEGKDASLMVIRASDGPVNPYFLESLSEGIIFQSAYSCEYDIDNFMTSDQLETSSIMTSGYSGYMA